MNQEQQSFLEKRYTEAKPVMYPHDMPQLQKDYPKAGDEGLVLAHKDPSITSTQLRERHEAIKSTMTNDMPKADKDRLTLTMMTESHSLLRRGKSDNSPDAARYNETFAKLVDYDRKNEHPIVSGVDATDPYHQRQWLNRENRDHPNPNSTLAQKERTYVQDSGLALDFLPRVPQQPELGLSQDSRRSELQASTGLNIKLDNKVDEPKPTQAPSPTDLRSTEAKPEVKPETQPEARVEPSERVEPKTQDDKAPDLSGLKSGLFDRLMKYKNDDTCDPIKQNCMTMEERVVEFAPARENVLAMSKGEKPPHKPVFDHGAIAPKDGSGPEIGPDKHKPRY